MKTKTELKIQEMELDHYESVYQLWESVDGLCLDAHNDSKECIARFLSRNPGSSFVAKEGEQIVGAVLCGHDGRVGMIRHLAVAHSHQRHNIGTTLVKRAAAKLNAQGIRGCLIYVVKNNEPAIAFWRGLGWDETPQWIAMYNTSLTSTL